MFWTAELEISIRLRRQPDFEGNRRFRARFYALPEEYQGGALPGVRRNAKTAAGARARSRAKKILSRSTGSRSFDEIRIAARYVVIAAAAVRSRDGNQLICCAVSPRMMRPFTERAIQYRG
jgi:hypothetical protein